MQNHTQGSHIYRALCDTPSVHHIHENYSPANHILVQDIQFLQFSMFCRTKCVLVVIPRQQQDQIQKAPSPNSTVHFNTGSGFVTFPQDRKAYSNHVLT